jgi:glycine/D-amino acid oxidase-like deaminating enzyme
MRVAILGAGFLGSCIALELEKRGIRVDLFDREEECITQAGYRNEGKIHLGFVYGADRSFRTADKMVAGGLSFYPLLRSLLGEELDTIPVSAPFIYLIEKTTLLSVNELENYFCCLERKILDRPMIQHPGGVLQRVERLSDRECRGLFPSERILAAYRTPERSVDSRAVALLLRRKLKSSNLITFYPKSELTGVSIQTNGVEIEYTRQGANSKRFYDTVVNALWDGRLALDHQVGLVEKAPWVYRLKHAIFLKTTSETMSPSVTIIQGPYGDVVNFGGGNFYLSWYPICKQGFSANQISPPHWNRNLSQNEAEKLAADTIAYLGEYVPCVKQIGKQGIKQLSVLGGVIYARGQTDVHDPESGLHERDKPAIQSKENYYSIDPGKFTLCPYFANQAARQICSTSTPSLSLC